jgi:hypothetical protein
VIGRLGGLWRNDPSRHSRLLGPPQLVSWGISNYPIDLFGDSIASDLRSTSDVVYGAVKRHV